MDRLRALLLASAVCATLVWGVIASPHVSDQGFDRHAEVAATKSPAIARVTLLGAESVRRIVAPTLRLVLLIAVVAFGLWAFAGGGLVVFLRRVRALDLPPPTHWAVRPRRGPPTTSVLAV
jgi:hypothetical protein